MMDEQNKVDNRKKYEITCPECGESLLCCKSLAHELGWDNLGFGHCLHCKKPFWIKYNFETDIMTTCKYEDETLKSKTHNENKL